MSESRPIKRLCFVMNGSKSDAIALGERLKTVAKVQGVEISSTTQFPVPEDILEGMDACCVIGGDGTFLSVASEATRAGVPLIGVNKGTLGFLTTYASEEIEDLFPDILEGEYSLRSRSLLECETQKSFTDLALNDVVIKSGDSGRIVHVDVFADEEYVTAYVCDGLIFSTPTGSTAYTLSAGGPLVHPYADVISLTPICAHTLSNRSIIFPHDVTLRVENSKSAEPLLVAVDGQRNRCILEESPIVIRKAKSQLQMAQKPDYSHFDVVRRKLKWNGGYAGEY